MKDVTLHEVYVATDKWPSKLESAKQVASQVGIPADLLMSWAVQGVCPHFRVNGGEPLFRTPDVKRWMVNANIIEACPGIADFGHFTLRVISDKPNVTDLPIELRSVGRVFDVANNLLPTGVYFLYLNGVLQYIGQSIEPATRLSQHQHSGKVFDRAFVIPVPSFLLNRVEGALIRHFRPPLNGKTAPINDEPDEHTLTQLGIIERILDGAEVEEM